MKADREQAGIRFPRLKCALRSRRGEPLPVLSDAGRAILRIADDSERLSVDPAGIQFGSPT